jgi:pSer/pThr/pTyr-binding forkhead associated (FHA) protein
MSPLERFRRACGLDDPLTLEYQEAGGSPGAYVPYRFGGPFALVGRDPRSDLVLDDPQVSRRHALLQVIEGRVFCIDLQSRLQLYWEGEDQPRTRGWLDPGRRLRIGPYRVRWSSNQATERRDPGWPDPLKPYESESMGPAPFPPAGLELPIRVGEGETFWGLRSRVALVGRSDACQLMLSDDSVSKHHAALVQTPDGVWVVDLRAREGTLVNGVRIRWAWLGDGDTVQFGRFTFILRYETRPHRLSREDVPLDAGAVAPAPGRHGPVASAGGSGGQGRALARRAEARSTLPSPAARSSRAVSPQILVPVEDAGWDLAVQVGPQQLAMWRQQMQMMESFHNDMILMVQMFVAMHREHLVSVREELDRVKQLTEELSDLQARLVRAHGSGEAGRSPGIDAATSKAGAAKPSSRKRQDRMRGATQASEPTKRTVPKPPGPARGTGPTAPIAAGAKNPPGRDDPSSTADHTEFHTILTRRITELQRERQGYWQRILSAINK